MSAQEERKFMHDLANPISIAQGNVKLVIRKLQKDKESFDPDQIISRLQKASDAFETVMEMLGERRRILIEQECDEDVNAS